MRLHALLILCAGTGAEAANVTAETTFYGAKDNCPPGGDIAHPKLHKLAGGTGTYADPITYAGATAATPAGTIIYVHSPNVGRYFIMEDDCEECQSDWKKSKKYHFDLWMGTDTIQMGPDLIACENAMTLSKTTVEIDPPSSYPANTTPLYNNVTKQCIIPAPPCVDVGNSCGNECNALPRGTCAEIEAILMLTDERFKQLNPTVNCSKEIAAGTNLCMGGTCGD